MLEVAMSEEEPSCSEPSGKGDGNQKQEYAQNPGDILGDIESYSRLICVLKDCLSGISRKIIDSSNELKTVQQELAQKKKELKELYDVEASAATLLKLQEEHRLKKSEFEKFIESRHRLWEEEKALKQKEDEEYRKALKLRWQQEEEEHRNKLASELSLGRQRLEEKLRQIQHGIEKQELLKRDLLEREQELKRKELEWVRLI
jgi:hypothetical protein